MTDDAFRDTAAAYVLGALAPDERQAFEAHLEECAHCRTEVVEFSPVPALLARVDAEESEAPPFDPGPALNAARRHHQRLRSTGRRWRLVAVATAAAAVVLGALLVVRVVGDDTDPAFDLGETVELAIDSAYVTEGTMTVNERDWGTRLEIDLFGLPERGGYRLWAVSTSDEWQIAGQWGPTPTGTCRVVGATSLKRAELDRLVITSLDRTEELATAR